ncbi:MAG: glycoside hydrolase family 130 protein [Lentisphaeria bacterium]|nr:glycoside hydrolase family 130 protein [Lentisphaeria bacterium]
MNYKFFMKNIASLKIEEQRFYPDISRVILQSFLPGNSENVRGICERILALSNAEVVYKKVKSRYEQRHADIETVFMQHYQIAIEHAGIADSEKIKAMSPNQKKLMGAYFSKEYSVEAAALFNPSIVPSRDQTGVADGALRFILSLRAVGEGHISSIVFRSGISSADGTIEMDPISEHLKLPEINQNPEYDKHTFLLKLAEMNLNPAIYQASLNSLNARFNYRDLENCIWYYGVSNPSTVHTTETDAIKWLALSNYQASFSDQSEVSSRVLFPYSENENNGIEDARFVEFTDDGKVSYFATYTAYNGVTVLPQLMMTRDFKSFRISTLNGDGVSNKGMALFPRKIGGKYFMIGRVDSENLFIMSSDNIHFWNKYEPLQTPGFAWDLIKIGNCGSPVETARGWLLMTHGVGACRQYAIGAMLLDLEDPSIVIAYLDEPIIESEGEDREGYVPNVVYTCGIMIHGETLIIPYAMSDRITGFVTVNIDDLLDRLVMQTK